MSINWFVFCYEKLVSRAISGRYPVYVLVRKAVVGGDISCLNPVCILR